MTTAMCLFWPFWAPTRVHQRFMFKKLIWKQLKVTVFYLQFHGRAFPEGYNSCISDIPNGLLPSFWVLHQFKRHLLQECPSFGCPQYSFQSLPWNKSISFTHVITFINTSANCSAIVSNLSKDESILPQLPKLTFPIVSWSTQLF